MSLLLKQVLNEGLGAWSPQPINDKIMVVIITVLNMLDISTILNNYQVETT